MNQKEYEENRKYKAALSRIRIFPGSLEEYSNKFHKVEAICEVSDCGFHICLHRLNNEIKTEDENRGKWLVDVGIEAIVNAQCVRLEQYSRFYYGLPVRGIKVPEVVSPSFVENDRGIKIKGEIRAV